MKDREVIKAFVDYLRANGYPSLQIDNWPEDTQDNDIDAIAGLFAIEHTNIDTVQYQQRDGHWFQRVVGDLETRPRSRVSFRLTINLPYDGITTGQNWPSISTALETWILDSAPTLPDGQHSVDLAPAVPFNFCASKRSSTSRPGVFFGRQMSDESYKDKLPERIRNQLDSKIKKLAKYQQEKTTVLLIENSDIALMEPTMMCNALQVAFPTRLPKSVNQLWYVDTATGFNFYDFTSSVCRKNVR